ncbi:MAG: DUF2326 domain-containing protein [Kiritimatiellae bacterium]|nr:DUF2326 domain-containing protein [Kiritimatiellia bacterium]
MLCSQELSASSTTLWELIYQTVISAVNDSHLFDAMAERQIANAIEVGARLSQQYGFQYICTLNSDYVLRNEFCPVFVSSAASACGWPMLTYQDV